MADWITLLPEQQRKEIAAALDLRNTYDQITAGLSEDAEDDRANELLASYNPGIDKQNAATRRTHARHQRTDAGNNLVKILEEGQKTDFIIRDAINYATTVSDPTKPDDERMAAETKYIIGLLSAVPIPGKDNMSHPAIGAIGKPLSAYRALGKALQEQDIGAIAEVMKNDYDKKKQADRRLHIDRLVAQDPSMALREGAKRQQAKLEEVAKAIAVKDATGNIVGPYDEGMVRQYIIKGLEAAKPDEKANVYTAFLNAASKGLKNAGYKA